jgi:hypothetical protein
MKRIVKFKKTEQGYGLFEKRNIIFEIRNDDLKFDVRCFYNAFFAEEKDYSDIELINEELDDKNGGKIFNCIKELKEKIVQRLKESSQALPKEPSK